jgi:putative ABC transport system permease protein
MFKLMWNRKRRNLLLMVEMLVSFLVLFALTSTMFGWGLQYLQPIGFESDDLWVIRVYWENKVKDQTEDEVRQLMLQMEQEATSFDEITGICWAYSNTPYSNSTWRSGIKWQGQDINYHYIMASDSYAEVLRIPMLEGAWFGAEHDASSITPVVINRKLSELFFGPEGKAVGRIVSDEDDEYLVVGVIDQYRYKGELDSQQPVLFERLAIADTATDPPSRAIIRVRPGVGVSFEKTFTDRLTQVVPSWSIRVEDVTDLRDSYFRTRYMMLLTPGVLGGFLVFNVALGLFGILWYSINRRKAELGLRRALGASAAQVNYQVIGEALVMATFSVMVGVILAAQAPILELMGASVSGIAYVLAIAFSAVLIYVLILACAWYPAHLAARIHPAEALHDE